MASKLVAVVVLVAFVTLSASAHHDFSDEFNPDALVRVRGRVVRIQITNPHTTVQLDVEDESGQSRIWTLHGDNPAQLSATGFTRQTLREGDRIAACGYLPKPPAKEEAELTVRLLPASSMSAEQITLRDGRKINFASNGPGTCLDPIVPDVVNRYTRIPGTDVVTESLPIVPMNTGPRDPVADGPVLGDVYSPNGPVLEIPVEPRAQPPVPPSVPTVAVQQRIPYDPLESGYLELYDRQKPVSLTGEVTRVDWNHPNTYVFINVNGAAWVVEASFIQFRQIAVSPAIHVGDRIKVEGYLPREKPVQPLPATFHPGVGPLLRVQRLIRAGQIVVSGFVLNMGIPPSDQEIARRSWCAAVRC